ncbi:MAG TPA: hypothetical protein VF271_01740 [Rhodanobacteraceae bacterium]
MQTARMTGIIVAVIGALTLGAPVLAAQNTPSHAHPGMHAMQSPAALIKAERQAMQPFADMAGIWRGPAHMTLRSGKQHTITQTERVGPFLGGSVMVMEGRGYEADGRVSFNALGVISYAPMRKAYTMRAYAEGHAGDFTLKPTADGFAWTIKAGPVTMNYTATIKNGTWHEVGTRTLPNGKSVKFFEMTLHRTGSTDWPAAGAVPFKS